MDLLDAKIGERLVIKKINLLPKLTDYAESRGVFVGNILRILRRSKSRVLVEIDQSVFVLPPIFTRAIEVQIL